MSYRKIEDKKIADSSDHAVGMQGSTVNYADNVVFHSRQGHGFAAEKANHLADTYSGEDACIVGGNNAKNGADRLVNGQLIQTKYCESGSKCIAATMDKDTGLFKYFDTDGKPMQIEVPPEVFDDAVRTMEKSIENGKVPGVTDPAEARSIVRKGRITYEQAKNVAKFGTVESLTYDAVNGIKLASTTMGITALLTFAVGVWQGKSKAEALEAACFTGICVGGTAWVTSILSAQVGRTGLENSMRSASIWVVEQMDRKVVDALANAFRDGNNLSGNAATLHAAKLLRGQVAVAIVVTTVLSVDDFIALFSREISGTQAFKNICKTAAGVVGGSAGAWGGTAAACAAGAKFGVVGGPAGVAIGAVGGLIGGAVGGFVASKVRRIQVRGATRVNEA